MEALTRPNWSPTRRCTATTRSGEQCWRQPIRGGHVCTLHGGATPQAQKAARTTLIAMVEPIIETFQEILDNWHSVACTGCGHVDERGVKCVGCGKPTGDPMPVIRIGQLVLDRAGFHPTLTVQHEEAPNEFDHLTIDQTIAELERLLAAAVDIRDNQRAHALLPATFDEGFEVVDAPIQDDGVQIPLATETPEEGRDDK